MKTPGQKAFDQARKLKWSTGGETQWVQLDEDERQEWESIAAAVTAPEPKSYGRVFREAYEDVCANTMSIAEDEADEFAAQAVIAEYRKREGLDK